MLKCIYCIEQPSHFQGLIVEIGIFGPLGTRRTELEEGKKMVVNYYCPNCGGVAVEDRSP